MQNLQVDVNTVIKQLEASLKALAENKLLSRYRIIFRGKGLEFEDFRVYDPSLDDASRIDWKTSARTNEMVIKLYKEERDLDVYFMVDVSNSMLFGSTARLKSEYAVEVVAALSHFILGVGDNVGLFLFNDSIVKALPKNAGRDHFFQILRTLVDVNNYGGKYNLSQALKYAVNIARRKGVLIVVSDFIGVEPGWEKGILVANTKFDVIAVMIRDPRDHYLPSVGQVVIQDPYSEKTILVDTGKLASRFSSLSLEEVEKVKRVFLRNDIDLIQLSTDKDFVRPFLEFLRGREVLFR